MSSTIMSADELSSQIDSEKTVVVDCRWYLGRPEAGIAAYRAGHLPGAIHVSLDTDLSSPDGPGRHPLPTPEAFAETCASLGITSSATVVAYDDNGGAIAARLWWMLRNQGHDRVFVLDGGIQAWETSGGKLTTDTSVPARGIQASRPWTATVDRDLVRNRAADTIVIDARSAERYRGESESVDPEAGHIPGALSMPLTRNLTDDLTFRTPNELRQHFASQGIDSDTKVFSQCGSGVTACHNILALTIAGMTDADLYVGSWSDWSTAGYPVATGDRPV